MIFISIRDQTQIGYTCSNFTGLLCLSCFQAFWISFTSRYRLPSFFWQCYYLAAFLSGFPFCTVLLFFFYLMKMFCYFLTLYLLLSFNIYPADECKISSLQDIFIFIKPRYIYYNFLLITLYYIIEEGQQPLLYKISISFLFYLYFEHSLNSGVHILKPRYFLGSNFNYNSHPIHIIECVLGHSPVL